MAQQAEEQGGGGGLLARFLPPSFLPPCSDDVASASLRACTPSYIASVVAASVVAASMGLFDETDMEESDHPQITASGVNPKVAWCGIYPPPPAWCVAVARRMTPAS